MSPNPKFDPEKTAATLNELVTADLPGTMAVLAGLLETVRENGDATELAAAKSGADLLRLEMNRWRKVKEAKEDPHAALLAAGKAAAAKK